MSHTAAIGNEYTYVTYLIVLVMVKCDFVILYLQISKCYLDVSTFKMNFYIHLDFQIKLVKVGQEDPENKNQDFSVMQ